MTLLYLDASAAVKLFKAEEETEALRAALAHGATWVSSELLSVEVRCTARRVGGRAVMARAEEVLRNVDLVAYTPAIQARAGSGFRGALRALDAIHAATALTLADDLASVLVYDPDLFAALAAEGLPVSTPGHPL